MQLACWLSSPVRASYCLFVLVLHSVHSTVKQSAAQKVLRMKYCRVCTMHTSSVDSVRSVTCEVVYNHTAHQCTVPAHFSEPVCREPVRSRAFFRQVSDVC